MGVIVAVTGASGAVIAMRLLEVLKEKRIETHLIISESGKKVIGYELGNSDEIRSLSTFHYSEDEIDAGIASSSNPVDAMVIAPCSLKTLSAVANGFCDNLITRCAENMLKLNRKLVVMPRDTPLSLAAIENMYNLKLSGAIILPPNMAYYYGPKTVDDVTDFFAGKILDALGIEHSAYRKWVKYDEASPVIRLPGD
ncbi:MAG: UbiX family flavin prenyltransferase [Candidatus Altiarchaeales archaeon]|nr:UbiX family flavin prenyltransferase [Candidatus Altiarchaeota archaeon]MCG2782535.1 UbiX family flavin prenyltransferase [Candidatus Altiarchaeales archaeon]MBU4266758.1 UbiX family flavin prenyltransferase [Candidatus Altiarchaeota archaeon]MBU4341454.1 UbiX family flavin prenyltransferase [Candidatus Altiarchaeota archaeon]MBU4406915.1 UbiX family flavin prenyltransferase [Candidatus Altiarchaeota archaeon]